MSKYDKRDIVEVISEHVDLKECGFGEDMYYVGKCPFHDDSSPSFTVYPNSQRAYCWACQTEGLDVIDFTMLIKNCGFMEAVSLVATERPKEEQILATLEALANKGKDVDLVPIAIHIRNIYTTQLFDKATNRVKRIFKALDNGQLARAFKL